MVRSVLLCCLETAALTKRQELEVAEMKMLRFSLGMTMNRIKNKHIRRRAKIKIEVRVTWKQTSVTTPKYKTQKKRTS